MIKRLLILLLLAAGVVSAQSATRETPARVTANKIFLIATADTCNTANKGGIYYDSDDDTIYYCNGTAWTSLATSGLDLSGITDTAILFDNSGSLGGFGAWNGTNLAITGTLSGITNIIYTNPSANQTVQPSADSTFIVKQANVANTVDIFCVKLKNDTSAFCVDKDGGWNSAISGAGYFKFTTGVLAVGAASTVKIGAHTGNLFAFSENGAAVQTVNGTLSVSFPAESKTNSTASDQDYTSIYSIPASYLTTGRCIRVTLQWDATTGTSAATWTQYVKLGTTKVITTSAPNPGDGITNRGFAQQFMFCGTAAAGASANVENLWIDHSIVSGLAGMNTVVQPVALATNGALVIVPGITFSSTGSTEVLILRTAIVEKIN